MRSLLFLTPLLVGSVLPAAAQTYTLSTARTSYDDVQPVALLTDETGNLHAFSFARASASPGGYTTISKLRHHRTSKNGEAPLVSLPAISGLGSASVTQEDAGHAAVYWSGYMGPGDACRLRLSDSHSVCYSIYVSARYVGTKQPAIAWDGDTLYYARTDANAAGGTYGWVIRRRVPSSPDTDDPSFGSRTLGVGGNQVALDVYADGSVLAAQTEGDTVWAYRISATGTILRRTPVSARVSSASSLAAVHATASGDEGAVLVGETSGSYTQSRVYALDADGTAREVYGTQSRGPDDLTRRLWRDDQGRWRLEGQSASYQGGCEVYTDFSRNTSYRMVIHPASCGAVKGAAASGIPHSGNDTLFTLVQNQARLGYQEARLERRINGEIDYRFGTAGSRSLPNTGGLVRAAQLDPTGRLLVVSGGSPSRPSTVFLPVSDGRLGPVASDSLLARPVDGVLQTDDGRRYVRTSEARACSQCIGGYYNAVARYLPDGTRDLRFGTSLATLPLLSTSTMRERAWLRPTEGGYEVATAYYNRLVLERWSGDAEQSAEVITKPYPIALEAFPYLDGAGLYGVSDTRPVRLSPNGDTLGLKYPRLATPNAWAYRVRPGLGTDLFATQYIHYPRSETSTGTRYRIYKTQAGAPLDSTFWRNTEAVLDTLFSPNDVLPLSDGGLLVLASKAVRLSSGTTSYITRYDPYLIRFDALGRTASLFGEAAPWRLPEGFRPMSSGQLVYNVMQFDADGQVLIVGGQNTDASPSGEVAILRLNLDGIASAAEVGETVASAELTAYPQPMRGSATVRFAARSDGPARLDLFDLLGRRVATLHDAPMRSGESLALPLDASALAPGAYLLRLVDGSGTRSLLVRKTP